MPTIAAVGGPAIGAGVNVALACDVIVCTPAARFDPRFLDIGIHPGGGVLWRLARADRSSGDGRARALRRVARRRGRGPFGPGLALRPRRRADRRRAPRSRRRAASRPRDLVRRTKQTLDEAASVTDGAGAVAIEIEHQRASMQDPAFLERVEQLRRKVQGHA